MTVKRTRESLAGAPTGEEIDRAVSVADAANSLAGYEVSEEVRELAQRFARREITAAAAIDAVAELAKFAPATS
jgi:hypothetical protein